MMKKLLSLAFSLLVVSNSFAAETEKETKETVVKDVAGLLAAKYEGQDLSNPAILEELACDCAEFIDSSMQVTSKERNNMMLGAVVGAVAVAAVWGGVTLYGRYQAKKAFAATLAGQVAVAEAAVKAAAAGTAAEQATAAAQLAAANAAVAAATPAGRLLAANAAVAAAAAGTPAAQQAAAAQLAAAQAAATAEFNAAQAVIDAIAAARRA